MVKPWKECRDSSISVLLKIAVLLGVSNHFYDPEKRQLVYTSGALVYRITLHLASFIAIIVNYNQLLAIVAEIIGDKAFLSRLVLVCMCVNVAVSLAALASELRSRGRGTLPLNELLETSVEDSVCREELALVQRHTWNLFFLKTMLIVLTLSSSVLTFWLQCSYNPALIAPSIGVYVLLIELLAFHHQFSLTMLYGGYLFTALNLHLSRVVRQVNGSLYLSRRKSRRLKTELARVGLLHTHLLNLMIRIKDIDQLQMLLILMSGFFYQVCTVFYLSLAARGLFGQMSIPTLFYSTGYTFLSTIDLLVGLHMCGNCAKACNAAGAILKEVDSFLVDDGRLERDIEVLSLQLAREKLHLTICGMFDLDSGTGPGMLKGIVLNVIILAQAAYDDLH